MRRPRLSYSQSLIVPLLNVSLNRTFIIHAGADYRLSIVSVSDVQRNRWQQDARVTFAIEGAPSLLPRTTSAVLLETRYSGQILDHRDANEDMTLLLGLLNVRLPYALWAPFGVVARGDDMSTMTFGETRVPTQMEYHADLNVADYKTFKRYWRTVSGKSQQSQRLRRAVSRFSRARSSWWAEDAIVHGFIGLEALFAEHTTEVGKTVNKVTRRLATFIIPPDASPTVVELTTLSGHIGEIYKLRHDILHGALPDPDKTGQAAKDTIELLRTAILIAVEEGFKRLKNLPALAADYTSALDDARREEKRLARRGDGGRKS